MVLLVWVWSERIDTSIMAVIMKTAPTREIIVSISFRKMAEIAVATIISVRSRIVLVEADMCFRPSSHR